MISDTIKIQLYIFAALLLLITIIDRDSDSTRRNENVETETPLRFLLLLVGCKDQLKSINVDPLFYQNINSQRTLNLTLLKCKEEYAHIDSLDESVYYLEYIYENYDELPKDYDIVIFAHAHEVSKHYRTPLHRQVQLLTQVPRRYLQSNHRQMGELSCDSRYNHIFAPTRWKPYKNLNMSDQVFWDHIFANTSLSGQFPDRFSNPCCGTFYLSTAAIQNRQRQEYRQIVQNIFKFNRQFPYAHQSRITGRLLESAWSSIFVNQPVISTNPWCDNEMWWRYNMQLFI